MVTNPDYDKDIIDDRENTSLRILNKLLEEMNFETNERGVIGEGEKVAEDNLPNTTR